MGLPLTPAKIIADFCKFSLFVDRDIGELQPQTIRGRRLIQATPSFFVKAARFVDWGQCGGFFKVPATALPQMISVSRVIPIIPKLALKPVFGDRASLYFPETKMTPSAMV